MDLLSIDNDGARKCKTPTEHSQTKPSRIGFSPIDPPTGNTVAPALPSTEVWNSRLRFGSQLITKQLAQSLSLSRVLPARDISGRLCDVGSCDICHCSLCTLQSPTTVDATSISYTHTPPNQLGTYPRYLFLNLYPIRTFSYLSTSTAIDIMSPRNAPAATGKIAR